MKTHRVTLRQSEEGIELGKGQDGGKGDENEWSEVVQLFIMNR